MQELKIYNGFGITPTNTFVSAGTDYYVPNIDINDKEKIKLAFEAFQKSYNKTYDELVAINELFLKVTYREQKIYDALINILHLYLALYNKELNNLKEHDEEKAVKMFINEYYHVMVSDVAASLLDTPIVLCIIYQSPVPSGFLP